MPRPAASTHRPPSPHRRRRATPTAPPPRAAGRPAEAEQPGPSRSGRAQPVAAPGTGRRSGARRPPAAGRQVGGARPDAGQQRGEAEHAGVLRRPEQRGPHPEEPLPAAGPARDPRRDAVGQQRTRRPPGPARSRAPGRSPARARHDRARRVRPARGVEQRPGAEHQQRAEGRRPGGRRPRAPRCTSQRSPMPRCSTFFSQVTAGRPALLRRLQLDRAGRPLVADAPARRGRPGRPAPRARTLGLAQVLDRGERVVDAVPGGLQRDHRRRQQPAGASGAGAPGEPGVAGELLEPVRRRVQPGAERAEPRGCSGRRRRRRSRRRGTAAAAARRRRARPGRRRRTAAAAARPTTTESGGDLVRASGRAAAPTGVSSRDSGRLTKVATKPSSDLVARREPDRVHRPARPSRPGRPAAACRRRPPAAPPRPGVERHRADPDAAADQAERPGTPAGRRSSRARRASAGELAGDPRPPRLAVPAGQPQGAGEGGVRRRPPGAPASPAATHACRRAPAGRAQSAAVAADEHGRGRARVVGQVGERLRGAPCRSAATSSSAPVPGRAAPPARRARSPGPAGPDPRRPAPSLRSSAPSRPCRRGTARRARPRAGRR